MKQGTVYLIMNAVAVTVWVCHDVVVYKICTMYKLLTYVSYIMTDSVPLVVVFIVINISTYITARLGSSQSTNPTTYAA